MEIEMIKIIGIFFTLQVINVILNTVKTLVMTRTNNPHISAIMNAVAFGFYVAVVKQIASLDPVITIIVTVVTNLIGVYFTYWIAEKFKKDNLWKIEIYNSYRNANFTNTLEKSGLQFTEVAPHLFNVYAYSQEDSRKCNRIIKKFDGLKYNITEITRRF